VLEEWGELGWAPDSHLVFVGTRVIEVVEDLEGLDLLHFGAESHEGHREEVVGEARVDAGGEAGRATLLARLCDGFDPRWWVLPHVRPHPGRHRRRAHVGSGAQEGADVADVGVGLPRRGPVVDQGVGAQGDECIEVVRGREAYRCDSADLPDVPPDLVLVVDTYPNQLEVRVTQDLGDHHLPYEPCSPDDDPLELCHWGIIAPPRASTRRGPEMLTRTQASTRGRSML